MKKFKVLTAILKNLCKKNRSVTYSWLTAIIIYLIVASYSFNFYNLADRANIGGCKVIFTAKNTDTSNHFPVVIMDITAHIKGVPSEDKFWTITLNVDPGKTEKYAVNLEHECSSKRQYKIILQHNAPDGRSAREIEYFYPSSSSYTTKTTINLGDVSRFFK
jgi:hypothetical protein